MKRSKILVCLMLALVLVVGMAGSAMAVGYDFRFYPPLPGSQEKSDTAHPTGSTPNVNPAYSPQVTTYYLMMGSTMISNQQNTTTAFKEFKYDPKYGGSAQNVCLGGNPRYADFTAYRAYGNWRP